ncbi:hypothetical protein [Kutzneria sp. CA-103260]|uniref:hypothetical protein n=1 Tax=Kutzneria sp. CA-103260 TaxID=2802641 RepID=UPI001BA5CF90|nr:hypothetical protein [Kutzneria sp. CA-103260]QUQ72504.1 hypothetical protein JJ691_102930 [Kutzneria sp. CA-103260]
MLRHPADRPAATALRPAPDHDTSCEPGHRAPNGFADLPGPGRSPAETSWRWCRAGRRKDLAAFESLLAPDAILHTPITDAFRFEGRAEVFMLLTIFFSKVDYLDYHTDVGEGATRVLGFHGRFSRIPFEEYLVLSFDEQHQVRHLVVATRGAAGLTAVFSSLGPDLLAVNHSRWTGRLARLAMPAAMWLVAALDRWVFPLAAPTRNRTDHTTR